ncbi:hypothetical protein O181_059852 [Austropuccinia psidii MF-1]|uniref:Reverse transcriptase RNase H-like domain-containing protein n=1 Tax=Austropuccinia psidii MF-1 TaxID=1389203 RepID=A0A9Q3HXT8_9BASI|nr:hypothetical protein [Austropuccinia psidii MF-1]
MAAGEVPMQEDKGKYRPVLNESITLSRLESKYSQPELELWGVAKMLKKLQTVLWGKNFNLQVDGKALIEMINSPCFPNALITRWVAFIQIFSFDLVHQPGKTFTMPYELSRTPQSKDEAKEKFDFEEEEECIRSHPGFVLKHNNIMKLAGIKLP